MMYDIVFEYLLTYSTVLTYVILTYFMGANIFTKLNYLLPVLNTGSADHVVQIPLMQFKLLQYGLYTAECNEYSNTDVLYCTTNK